MCSSYKVLLTMVKHLSVFRILTKVV